MVNRTELLRLFARFPEAFWRHDVDMSLHHARKMASVAELAGIKSTFYLMPRGDEYNLFGPEGRDTVSQIINSGHKLGVHTWVPPGQNPETTAYADLELVKLRYPHTFGRRVSFHLPQKNVLWKDIPGIESAYHPRWEGRYFSDSRGKMPDLTGAGGRVQINLHPEWHL
jgi:hypothetical protein